VGEAAAASGPDFASGISANQCPEGRTLAGRVGDTPVLLSRLDGEFHAVGGTCTHYGAALADGLTAGNGIRCPLHHACFDLKTGAALRAPALDPLDCWRVELRGDTLFVREKLAPAAAPQRADGIGRVVIVGGGAAGLACANELRRLGHAGEILMLSADADPPCDRPNLSKDYLAGSAPEEWIPLRSPEWYSDNRITLRLGTEVRSIDTRQRTVATSIGEPIAYDRLLLATGAEPRRLDGRGFDGERVLTLRSLGDARVLAARAKPGAHAAIIGSSFIGLEAAAALRSRGVEVDIVSPEHVPFERVFGAEIGTFLQRLHEDKGVRFHLNTVAAALDGGTLALANGKSLPADFVLLAVGVSPRTALAQAAGLEVEGGVLVDEFLETSAPGVFAAGDIAAYPDPATGERIRIEHWAVALRQGQTAAANMLGLRRPFRAAPFFWTEQYGLSVRYVGHARDWDEVRVDGDIGEDGFLARYFAQGTHRASASVNRDRESLEDELQFEALIADKAGDAPLGERGGAAVIQSAA
jgi:NADPH-dependent 2,4-dienoyl-CoA reductase/sulfur reductase-like enzyme/nitrite reductase/ring-hydroxylating ferredoxin subunit